MSTSPSRFMSYAFLSTPVYIDAGFACFLLLDRVPVFHLPVTRISGCLTAGRHLMSLQICLSPPVSRSGAHYVPAWKSVEAVLGLQLDHPNVVRTFKHITVLVQARLVGLLPFRTCALDSASETLAESCLTAQARSNWCSLVERKLCIVPGGTCDHFMPIDLTTVSHSVRHAFMTLIGLLSCRAIATSIGSPI